MALKVGWEHCYIFKNRDKLPCGEPDDDLKNSCQSILRQRVSIAKPHAHRPRMAMAAQAFASRCFASVGCIAGANRRKVRATVVRRYAAAVVFKHGMRVVRMHRAQPGTAKNALSLLLRPVQNR